ncbi:unnamed protein product, partial [marine sediment metagenome]
AGLPSYLETQFCNRISKNYPGLEVNPECYETQKFNEHYYLYLCLKG